MLLRLWQDATLMIAKNIQFTQLTQYLVSFCILAALAAATGATPAPVRTLKIQPTGSSEFVHSLAVRSTSRLKQGETGKPVTLIDVTTHVVHFKTGESEFDGTVNVTVTLEQSESQKFTEMMAPLGGQSPLKAIIGQSATYRGRLGEELTLIKTSAQNPETHRFVAHALAEMAQSFISPFEPPQGPITVGARFESSTERIVRVENTEIPIEDMRRFQVLRIEGDLVEIAEEIAIRPRKQNQIDGVFGRGRGRLVLDLKHGIVRRREETLNTEARVWAKADWVYLQSESKTEAYTIPAAEYKP